VRRPSIIGLLILSALGAASAPAAAQDTPDTRPPRLAAKLESCTKGALRAQRAVAFVGSMPAVPGAERMQMRFDLERLRPGQRRWRRMRNVPGFGSWDRSAPMRAGFIFHKRVDGLAVPASYRAVVSFRWEDRDGRLVRRARRRTAACTQPDLRPDLVPGVLTGALDPRPGFAVYTLLVRNTGRSEAGPFSVRVGAVTADVDGLPAGEERAVRVAGPVCAPGTATVVEVDAGRRIEESRERGNASPRICPLPAG
jgi:hypothetical protein